MNSFVSASISCGLKMIDKGLIEYLSGFATTERRERFDEVLANRTRYITVILEELYQEQNASAVLRTCDCFGIQDVHVIEGKNKFSVNDAIAMGASKWLSINKYTLSDQKLKDCIVNLKERNYRIVATVPDQNAVPLQDFGLSKGPVALMFGTELNGLSEESKNYADEFLYIPMAGFTESFNISVSAGIILHYLTDQLQHSNISWKLSEDEKDELILNWLRASVKSSELLEAGYYLKGAEPFF
jgi:tRNA (guanosine-2'-O-)-methyltransferase